jgi:hypothetical protein
MSPMKLGNVWPIRARLYNNMGILIGTCMDTPNSIAKAFMEVPEAVEVKPYGCSRAPRSQYQDRMKDWNEAASHYQPNSPTD